MNFEDIKDRIKSEALSVWEKIQNSNPYMQLADRFENLSPSGQRLVYFSAAALGVLILVWKPYQNLMEARDFKSEFESKRGLISQLFEVTREASDAPQIPPAPTSESLKSSIESDLKTSDLLDEQIKEIRFLQEGLDGYSADFFQGTMQVSLAKLNLRQVVDIGKMLQALSVSLKLKDLKMHANKQDARYYDVDYALLILNVPGSGGAELEDAPAPAAPIRKRK